MVDLVLSGGAKWGFRLIVLVQGKSEEKLGAIISELWLPFSRHLSFDFLLFSNFSVKVLIFFKITVKIKINLVINEKTIYSNSVKGTSV